MKIFNFLKKKTFICERCGIDLKLLKKSERYVVNGKNYCDICMEALSEKNFRSLAEIDKFLKQDKNGFSENLQKDLALMEIPKDFWKKQKNIPLRTDCEEEEYRWRVLCHMAELWGKQESEDPEEIYEISIQALEKVFPFYDQRLKNYVQIHLDSLNTGENLGFWTYDYHKKKFETIPYGCWIDGRYPSSLFRKKVRTIFDEKEPFKINEDGYVDNHAYNWKSLELLQDGNELNGCYVLTYREGRVSFFNSVGNSRYFVLRRNTTDLSDETLVSILTVGRKGMDSIPKKEKALMMIAAKTKVMNTKVPEKTTSIFSSCGPLTAQLDNDIARMGISEEFLKKPYILPMSFGYDAANREYFAAEPRDREYGMVPLFSGSDTEAFRWYLLESIAKKWGQHYERENLSRLEQNWQKVRDKVEDGNWTYHIHPNARYKAVYDRRKESWEEAIHRLAKVYDIRGEQMQHYIQKCLSYLGAEGENWSEIHWKFDEKNMEFTGIPLYEPS